MSRGLNNKNPLNLKRSSDVYEGEITSSDERFKQFSSMAYGYRAAFRNLYAYETKHGLYTIRGLISRWAPSNENNTSTYIDTVSMRSGIGADEIISTRNEVQMVKIVAAMSFVENGVPAVMADVEAGWNLFINEI
ncbi:MAG: structural protein P5 [Bacteroidales bacterium]|jgi:hypothetical protein|nr:structural protein P5 [Bacteroidales bacterium]MCI2145858.1 structural protein P5 [Bacteroidales bacterium]